MQMQHTSSRPSRTRVAHSPASLTRRARPRRGSSHFFFLLSSHSKQDFFERIRSAALLFRVPTQKVAVSVGQRFAARLRSRFSFPSPASRCAAPRARGTLASLPAPLAALGAIAPAGASRPRSVLEGGGFPPLHAPFGSLPPLPASKAFSVCSATPRRGHSLPRPRRRAPAVARGLLSF